MVSMYACAFGVFLGTLCMQLLLQLLLDRFETLQAFSTWSENVHILWP